MRNPDPRRAGSAHADIGARLMLVALGLIWGITWPVMKIGLNEIPPLTMRATAAAFGAVTYYLMCVFMRRSLRISSPKAWAHILVGSLLNIVAFSVFSAFAQLVATTSRVAILAYTMPIWSTILAALFLGERLTLRLLAALALAMAGIGVLLSPGVAQLGHSPLGVALTLGAALSWALGTFVQKRVVWPIPVLAVAGWQLVLGGAPFVVVTLAWEPIVMQNASAVALWATVYTVALPLLFCQYAWLKVVSLFPASIASIGTVLVPIVGVLSGALVLGEAIGWREIAALLLVLASLVLVVLTPAAASARQSPDRGH